MALLKVLAVVSLFSTTSSSAIKLNNGGYEDIVIALHPGINEDPRIIESIQDMVKEATSYLYHATKNRLYIKSVKILIPLSWSKNNYTKPKTETYAKADVIIAHPHVKYGDDPYTLQYEKCGEAGKYIHFTSNFLVDDNVISLYGPRGRAFVHEWAHLRWGVYDEYSTEKPYYISSSTGKPEATRCSFDIFGINVKFDCKGKVCNTKPCNFNPGNDLYEEGCVFVPEENQFVKNSIMYMQSLSDVTEFCDSHNHNIEADNLHNKLCNLRSTWDIIMNSTDIRSTPPTSNTTIPVPTFQLLQYSKRVITLVLDVSGSMSRFERINRLYQAADIFLTQVIELNAYVGLVQFSNTVSILSPLTEITGQDVREQLKKRIPQKASGGTNICLGILKGIEVNKQYDGLSDGSEIILLSDGEDNYNTRVCIPDIEKSGAIFNVIALGPDEATALREIVSMTGGIHILATDKVDANGLIDAFSSFSASDGDIFQQSIQLESNGLSLRTAECLNGTVYIDSALGNDTFFLVTWQNAVPDIHLQDPNTKVYTAVNFISDTATKSSKLQIPGTAETGPWHYTICNPFTSTQVIGIVVNSRAASKHKPPITVTAHMNKNTNTYPDPMVVYALVSQGMMPVAGAKVTAIIEPVNGNPVTLELLDNGAGADMIKDDGVYSRYFTTFTENGRYSLKIRTESVENKSRLRLPQNRALYIPGYLNNGIFTMNPPRPTFSDDDFYVDAFSRTILGGSFVLSNVPSVPQWDIYPPERITDLEARFESDKVVLVWTATGDDMDQGRATSYDLRMSRNPLDLRDNFYSSTKINISSIFPLPVGSRETFAFVPGNIIIENGTILYFALVASDKAAQSSAVSNIAKAALFIPPTPAPTTTTTVLPSTRPKLTTSSNTTPTTVHASPGNKNFIHLALIVCSTIILICLIISITLCIVTCQKTKKNPQMGV